MGTRLRLDYYYVLSVPYVAGFSCFSGLAVGGFRLTGWVFVIMLAAAPFVYWMDRSTSRFPLWIWLPWIVIVIGSLSWADTYDLHTFQDVLQAITPFVIAPIASKAFKSIKDIEALFNALGAELIEREGSRIEVFLFGEVRVYHRPHPRPDTDKGAVASIRKWLKENEVLP